MLTKNVIVLDKDGTPLGEAWIDDDICLIWMSQIEVFTENSPGGKPKDIKRYKISRRRKDKEEFARRKRKGETTDFVRYDFKGEVFFKQVTDIDVREEEPGEDFHWRCRIEAEQVANDLKMTEEQLDYVFARCSTIFQKYGHILTNDMDADVIFEAFLKRKERPPQTPVGVFAPYLSKEYGLIRFIGKDAEFYETDARLKQPTYFTFYTDRLAGRGHCCCGTDYGYAFAVKLVLLAIWETGTIELLNIIPRHWDNAVATYNLIFGTVWEVRDLTICPDNVEIF